MDYKDKILNSIIDKYIKSNNCNGTSVYLSKIEIGNGFNIVNVLNNEVFFNENLEIIKNILIELINEEKIEVISSKYTDNPTIKLLPTFLSIDEQIQLINGDLHVIVLFPTKRVLSSKKISNEKKFTKMLKKGEHHLKIIYFDPTIVEEYVVNPKYIFKFDGIRGYILLSDEFINRQRDYEYIKDFGMAYFRKNGKFKRAIGVFLTDLNKLSVEDQMHWSKYMLNNQQEYTVHPNFVEQLLYGRWSNNTPIYQIMIEMRTEINNVVNTLKMPNFYKTNFDIYDENIFDFRTIFSPTKRNYDNFIMVLEKLFINDINKDFFTTKSFLFKKIENTKNDDGTKKASITLFSEWIDLNLSDNSDYKENDIKVLKDIRKKRQKPAHDLESNNYNEEYWSIQNEIIIKCFYALRMILIQFLEHPNCSYETKQYILNLDEITIV